jgi:histidine triad (HIT) family protein
MSECIFCQIIHKRAPASIVYEDEQVVAFLSNGPVNPGHTLVVPKKHHANIYEASEEEVAYLFKITKRMAQAVRDATGVQGIRIVQNNGKDAGQVVFHLHVHVIPMKPHNHFQFDNPNRSIDLLEEDAQKIRAQLKIMMT